MSIKYAVKYQRLRSCEVIGVRVFVVFRLIIIEQKVAESSKNSVRFPLSRITHCYLRLRSKVTGQDEQAIYK